MPACCDRGGSSGGRHYVSIPTHCIASHASRRFNLYSCSCPPFACIVFGSCVRVGGIIRTLRDTTCRSSSWRGSRPAVVDLYSCTDGWADGGARVDWRVALETRRLPTGGVVYSSLPGCSFLLVVSHRAPNGLSLRCTDWEPVRSATRGPKACAHPMLSGRPSTSPSFLVVVVVGCCDGLGDRDSGC